MCYFFPIFFSPNSLDLPVHRSQEHPQASCCPCLGLSWPTPPCRAQAAHRGLSTVSPSLAPPCFPPLQRSPPCTMGTLCALSAAVQAQPEMLGSLSRTLGWGGSISTQQLQKFPTPGEAQLRHGGVPSPTEPRCPPSARTASARGLQRAAAQINGDLSAHHCIHLEGHKPRRRLFGNTAKLVRSASDLPIERLLGLGTAARSCRDKAAWRYQMLRP